MTHQQIGQIISQMSAPVALEQLTLETERLVLRPLTEGDLADIHEICSQPRVAETAGWQCSKDLEMSRLRLREYMDDKETLAVVLKENGKVIGTVSLQKRPWHMYPIDTSLRGRELGFDLSEAYWGRGLMPEAVRALSRCCFEKLHYDFLTAGYFRGNEKSRRAIEKCGFSFLFEDDREIPGGRVMHILTYIQYNPQKEIQYV